MTINKKLEIGDSVTIPEGVRGEYYGTEDTHFISFPKPVEGIVCHVWSERGEVRLRVPAYYNKWLTYSLDSIDLLEGKSSKIFDCEYCDKRARYTVKDVIPGEEACLDGISKYTEPDLDEEGVYNDIHACKDHYPKAVEEMLQKGFKGEPKVDCHFDIHSARPSTRDLVKTWNLCDLVKGFKIKEETK